MAAAAAWAAAWCSCWTVSAWPAGSDNVAPPPVAATGLLVAPVADGCWRLAAVACEMEMLAGSVRTPAALSWEDCTARVGCCIEGKRKYI